jgi:hypothetical protein
MRQVVQLVPVEGSTAVKAVGFDSGIIRILWRSGSFNDYEGRSQSDFDDLLASPSKGRFVRERLAGGGPAIARHSRPDAPRYMGSRRLLFEAVAQSDRDRLPGRRHLLGLPEV